MGDRRYDIDWLRVFATYLLFPFHVGKVFDVPPFYHIKNGELSHGLGVVTTYIHQWHMPLFFLLAGWSLHASLNLRGPGHVLLERVKRIFIPFLFGCLTLCVGLGYVEHILMKHVDMTFLDFIPRFFTSLDYFTWGHLWFLIYLFTFTILYFPLFLKAAKTSSPHNPQSSVNNRQLSILYLPLPLLILAQLILRIWWGGFQNLVDDWGNFVYYSSFLWLGFLIGRHPALQEAINREWKRAALITAVTSVVFLYFRVNRPASDVTWHFIYYTLGTIVGYTAIITLLGWAYQHLRFRSRALDYLAESALPVYILHQGGIVFTGWFIINMQAPIVLKLPLLLAAAVAFTMLVYHLIIRPIGPLRFLFGMKPKPRPARAA